MTEEVVHLMVQESIIFAKQYKMNLELPTISKYKKAEMFKPISIIESL